MAAQGEKTKQKTVQYKNHRESQLELSKSDPPASFVDLEKMKQDEDNALNSEKSNEKEEATKESNTNLKKKNSEAILKEKLEKIIEKNQKQIK